MRSEYLKWIEENVKESLGKCAETTLAMNKAFPELRRVRGHYYDAFQGERSHWWLVDEDGVIVDPTKDQFPDWRGEYVEWGDEEEEPTGRCPNCGEYVYGGKMFCDDNCALEARCALYR